MLLYFDIMENVLNKVGHLLSELGFDPHSILIQHHDSETLLLRLVSKIRFTVDSFPDEIVTNIRSSLTKIFSKKLEDPNFEP